MNFYNIDWSYIMDWVVFASCLVLIITVVFDIIKSVKDKKGLSDEHQRLEQGQKNIKDTIKETINEKQSIVLAENNKIRDIVTNIDKTIFAEKEKNNERYKNLNEDQKDIKKHIEAVSQLMKELERLQTESIEQKKLITKLSQENKILHEQLAHSQQPILPGQVQTMQDFDHFTQSR